MSVQAKAPAANENTVTVLENDTIQDVLHSMLTADSFNAVVTDDKGNTVGRIDSDMVAAAVNG